MNNLNKHCKSCSKEPTDRINVARFINVIDKCFETNDLEKAVETVRFWENEARAFGDTGGLLSVLNEELGLYRRIGDRENGIRAINEVQSILQGENAAGSLSRATVYINLATTMKAFGFTAEGIKYYERAGEIFESQGKKSSYEYAALLNNKSSALCELEKFDEAETCLDSAIVILGKLGGHGADMALSYVSLAHLYYDRDDTAYEKVEKALDTAWELINSPDQKRDGDYAFALTKCAPSFKYFGRELEAKALEDTASEIYGDTK